MVSLHDYIDLLLIVFFVFIGFTLFAFLFYFSSYMHRLFIKKTIISTLKSIKLGYDCEYPLVRILSFKISTDQYCIHPYCIARLVCICRIVSSIVELIVYLYMFKVLLLVVEYDLFDYQLYLHWIHRYHQVISTLNALFDYFCCIYSIKYNSRVGRPVHFRSCSSMLKSARRGTLCFVID